MVLKYPSKLFMTMLLFSLVANFSCNSEKKEKEKKQYEEEFWKECTIEFSGKIINTKMLSRGFGLACIQLAESKIIKDELYFKDDIFVYKAKADKIVFVLNVAAVEIGDSISFNINQDHTIRSYRKDELVYDSENPVIYKTYDSYLYTPTNIDCLND